MIFIRNLSTPIMPRKFSKQAPKRRKRARPIPGTMRPGAPSILFRKLRYTGIASLSLVATGAASHLWTANGLFDPDITGTGHQPRNFDQIMTQYDHYTVLGSKVTLDCVNNQATSQGVIIASTMQDDNVSLTSLDDLMEYPKRRHKILTGGAGGFNKTRFTQSYSCKKYFHTKPLSDSNQQGSVASNPSEGAFFGVYAHTVDNAIGTGTVDVMVTIDYIVAFQEVKQPVKS